MMVFTGSFDTDSVLGMQGVGPEEVDGVAAASAVVSAELDNMRAQLGWDKVPVLKEVGMRYSRRARQINPDQELKDAELNKLSVEHSKRIR